MAWTNADWEEESTPELRLSKLRAWRTELRNALTLGVTEQGYSVSSADIRQALKDSEAQLQRLEDEVRARAATNRPLAVTTKTARTTGRSNR